MLTRHRNVVALTFNATCCRKLWGRHVRGFKEHKRKKRSMPESETRMAMILCREGGHWQRKKMTSEAAATYGDFDCFIVWFDTQLLVRLLLRGLNGVISIDRLMLCCRYFQNVWMGSTRKELVMWIWWSVSDWKYKSLEWLGIIWKVYSVEVLLLILQWRPSYNEISVSVPLPVQIPLPVLTPLLRCRLDAPLVLYAVLALVWVDSSSYVT